MNKFLDVVLMAKEAVARGTEGASYALDQPFLGGGLVTTIRNNLGQIVSNSTHPYPTSQVPVGVTASLQLTPDLNVATIRDLILLGVPSSGVLPSVSIKHTRGATGLHQKYLGCVCGGYELGYSRGPQPDDGAVLQGGWNFECMSLDDTTGVSAGTKGTGRYFAIQHCAFTLNSVAATRVLNYRSQRTIALGLGPPNASSARLYIDEGTVEDVITLTAQFAADTWSALVRDATAHAATIVHGTGTANETLTETMATQQIESHTLGEQDGVVTEEITIRPYGATARAFSFGSSIGASVLSLP